MNKNAPSRSEEGRRLRHLALFVVTVLGALASLPRVLCGWRADAVFEGDLAAQRALADGVVAQVQRRKAVHYYSTADARFDGQSAVAIDQMALMGLSQIVALHPELGAAYVPVMRTLAAHLADPRTLDYARRVYGHHGVDAMGPAEGHAYLGYINLGLGMLRAVDPNMPLVALHDQLSQRLADRLFASKTGLIETYPGETWPPDVAAVAGSVGLHAALSGRDRSAEIAAWSRRFAACAIGADGYLVQRVQSGSCRALDAPRGSGTAVAAYFLSFIDSALARRLHGALVSSGERTLFGFGAIREYARGYAGRGDLNAGPVVLGVSVGATGFALGAAGVARDRDLFRELYRTLDLFGAPSNLSGADTFVVGGTLGNALLLAMLTARPR